MVDAIAAAKRAKQVIKTLSDVLKQNHTAFAYPKSRPTSQNGRATQDLQSAYAAISRAYAAVGDARNARRFVGLAGPEFATYAQPELIKLYQRQGDTVLADEILQEMYLAALSENNVQIKAHIFSTLINAL